MNNEEIKTIITTERAIQLIRLVVPYLENTQVTIDHIGDYDKKGCRHHEAIAVIQFNSIHQITIWNKGIRFYRGDRGVGESSPSDLSNVFDACRLLKSWSLIS